MKISRDSSPATVASTWRRHEAAASQQRRRTVEGHCHSTGSDAQLTAETSSSGGGEGRQSTRGREAVHDTEGGRAYVTVEGGPHGATTQHQLVPV